MNHNSNVPIPERMKHLKVYHGFPMPYTVFVDKKGVPDFKVTDDQKHFDVIMNRKCAICGVKIEGNVFFIGGGNSLTHEKGAFYDPAMHEECAMYSFQVCPFIAMGKAYASKGKKHEGVELKELEMISAERPDKMGLLETTNYEVVNSGGTVVAVPVRPPVKITWEDEILKQNVNSKNTKEA